MAVVVRHETSFSTASLESLPPDSLHVQHAACNSTKMHSSGIFYYDANTHCLPPAVQSLSLLSCTPPAAPSKHSRLFTTNGRASRSSPKARDKRFWLLWLSQSPPLQIRLIRWSRMHLHSPSLVCTTCKQHQRSLQSAYAPGRLKTILSAHSTLLRQMQTSKPLLETVMKYGASSPSSFPSKGS